MCNSKLKREFLRVLLQIDLRFSRFFPRSFSSNIKIAWNNIQRDEGSHVYASAYAHRSGSVALDLSSTSGFGETVHPDVICSAHGFGAGNWNYLMTVTPFPMGIVYFENPEFLVSRDGIMWELPPGGKSPVVAPPYDWIGYNSDPVLLLEDGFVRLIYREVCEKRNGFRISLISRVTDDGISWRACDEILSSFVPLGREGVLMSPAVCRVDGEYFLWYVDDFGGEFKITRVSGRKINSLTTAAEAVISDMPDDLMPWHIGIASAPENGRLVMAICAAHKKERGIHSIIFAESFDMGIIWHIIGERMDPLEAAGECSLYKASLLWDDAAARWRLYYSYRDLNGHWFTCLKTVTL